MSFLLIDKPSSRLHAPNAGATKAHQSPTALPGPKRMSCNGRFSKELKNAIEKKAASVPNGDSVQPGAEVFRGGALQAMASINNPVHFAPGVFPGSIAVATALPFEHPRGEIEIPLDPSQICADTIRWLAGEQTFPDMYALATCQGHARDSRQASRAVLSWLASSLTQLVSGRRSARIHLRSSRLGTICLDLDVRDGSVAIGLDASHLATEALLAETDTLAAELDLLGLRLAAFLPRAQDKAILVE